MTERTNTIIIIVLAGLASYALFLGMDNLASACAGSLGTALTSFLKGQDHEKTASAPPATGGV